LTERRGSGDRSDSEGKVITGERKIEEIEIGGIGGINENGIGIGGKERGDIDDRNGLKE
jgi:hypothetical protein